MTTITLSPARPKVRPSISDGDDRKSEIRAYDGSALLGRLSPVRLEWPEPFKALIRDADIEIERPGRANRVEVDADGFHWEGFVTYRVVREGGVAEEAYAPTVLAGDSLRLTIHLPVEGL